MRLPAEQRRRQLLDVACEVFAERGFHATSMDDIAEAAGRHQARPLPALPVASGRCTVELLDDIGRRLLDRARRGDRGRADTGPRAGRGRLRRLLPLRRRAPGRVPPAVRRVGPQRPRVRADRRAGPRRRRPRPSASSSRSRRTPEQRRVLAHAIVGMAEATSRDALTDDGAEVDADQLAALDRRARVVRSPRRARRRAQPRLTAGPAPGDPRCDQRPLQPRAPDVDRTSTPAAALPPASRSVPWQRSTASSSTRTERPGS